MVRYIRSVNVLMPCVVNGGCCCLDVFWKFLVFGVCWEEEGGSEGVDGCFEL